MISGDALKRFMADEEPSPCGDDDDVGKCEYADHRQKPGPGSPSVDRIDRGGLGGRIGQDADPA